MNKFNSISKKLGSESGALLMASTLGMFILLSLFAFYISRLVVQESRNAGFHALDIKTRNLALSGMEHGLQSFKSNRTISTLQGNFNTGSYTVTFDTLKDETQTALPYSHYSTLKSVAQINEVERHIRLFVSSFPEAFCFSYYGNNAGGTTFNESTGAIVGDMYFNGNVSTSIVSSGTVYNSTGSGGTLLSNPPNFPAFDSSLFDSLLTVAENTSGIYQNYALDFDGSNDYVEASGFKGVTGTSSRTVEMWIKTSTTGMLSNWGQNSPGKRFGIRVNNNGNYGNIGCLKAEVNSGYTTGSTDLRDGNWHHIAVTLNDDGSPNANEFKLYVDGVLEINSKTLSRGINTASSANVVLGSNESNGDDYFNGEMDEVRIWSVERNASQISATKDSVLTGSETGLVAYYNFQENSGSTANDTQTQENNDGTINGASWTNGPILSNMSQSIYSNTTINLSTYSNNQLFINGNVTLSNVTVNGPGYLVVNGNITIQSSTNIKKGVHILCSGNLTMTSSQIGGSVRTPGLLYVEGTTSLSSSTAYGLIIAKGTSCALSATSLFGGVLNYSSSFTLNNTSTITGSLVSQYSMDIQDSNSSITKGNLPPYFGLDIGLNSIVVPGSYLEY